ncbi:MAG: cupin domain-containing protein [Chitinophagaceae bacterium]
MKPSADYWIDRLQLSRHIEGGSYRRTYTASLTLPKQQLPTSFNGPRPVATAIYFLLEKEQISAMHRIASDELWHFYYGDPLVVYEINASGILTQHLLGNNPLNGEQFQCVVKAGSWFGSKTIDGGNYSLVGCTVSPGFDFDDFELGDRNTLLQLYPQHANIISMLTKV